MARFTLHHAHQNFFHTHHFLELEGLFSHEESATLKKRSIDILSKRLQMTEEALMQCDLKTLYLSGRDLWREDLIMQKSIFSFHLAKIAFLLTKKRPLRILYDHLLFSPRGEKGQDHSLTFLNRAYSLKQLSSFQGVVCALLLQLNSPNPSYPALTLRLQKEGNGLFFHPDLPLSWGELLSLPTHQLLIVYGEENALYVKEERDPLGQAPKKWGYSFGDVLKKETHPFLYQGI